jgi:hypothetical protein
MLLIKEIARLNDFYQEELGRLGRARRFAFAAAQLMRRIVRLLRGPHRVARLSAALRWRLQRFHTRRLNAGDR